MAEKAKKIKTGKGLTLAIVNPDAAGIDVSSTGMQVCVPEDNVISDAALLRLMGELGHDFTGKFESCKQFCCWCNLTPNNKISGAYRQRADTCPPLSLRQTNWEEYSTRWSTIKWNLTNRLPKQTKWIF